MKKSTINVIKSILGIIILIILFYKLGLGDAFNTLKNINFYFVIIFLCFFFLSILGFSFNIFILLKKFDKNIIFAKLIKYTLIAWAAGMILPGKIGEFSLTHFLKKYEIGIGETSSILVLDKIITLMIIAILAILGFFIFFDITQTIYLIISLIVLFIMIFIFIITDFGRGLIKKYILRKKQSLFKRFSKTMFEYFKHYKQLLIINTIVTIIRILTSGLMVHYIFKSLGVNVSLFMILLIFSMSTIISLIPITISGLGIKQSFGAYMYSLMGVPNHIIAGNYIINLLLVYGVSFIILMSIKKEDIFFNKEQQLL